MKENLFSYGTLQKNEVQKKLFGRLLTGAKDVLTGYKPVTIEIGDETFLANGEDEFQLTLTRSQDEADAVEGTVFELSREELDLTDSYEPENYKRIRVVLRSGRDAWIYVAAEVT